VSHQIVGRVADYRVKAGDTLAILGSRAGVDAAILAASNQLPRTTKLRVGQTLSIDNRHIAPRRDGASIVVNIPQRMLFAFEGDDVRAFPVALGRPTWPTPTGTFRIVTKETDPTWDVPVSIQHEMQRAGRAPLLKVPPGPDNPLGDRWFGLSLPGIGIHGTSAPSSIYHHQTHGCIRLHPDDIRELFDRLVVGTAGEIVYEPVLLAVMDGHVFLESHSDVYRRGSPNLLAWLRVSAEQERLTDVIDWSLAVAVIQEHAGIARDVTTGPWLTD
jgi:L,D-transpeptidase ErfK/SrfK